MKSVQEGGEGVKKAGKSAYVLNGCSLIVLEAGKCKGTDVFIAKLENIENR